MQEQKLLWDKKDLDEQELVKQNPGHTGCSEQLMQDKTDRYEKRKDCAIDAESVKPEPKWREIKWRERLRDISVSISTHMDESHSKSLLLQNLEDCISGLTTAIGAQ